MNPFGFLWIKIILVWLAFICIYIRCAKRDGRAPLDDIGVLFLLVLGLYTTLPPISWLLQGGEYAIIAGRLFTLQPSVEEVNYVMNIALTYQVSFAVVYYLFLNKIPLPSQMTVVRISNAHVVAAGIIVFFSTLITLGLFASGAVRGADSYLDSYLVIQQLPLALRQSIKLINAFSAVASIIVMVTLFQRWTKYKWLFWIFLVNTLLSFNAEGGRTAIAINLLSMAICWHVFVRSIPTRVAMAGGIFGLLTFLALGIFRNIGSLTGADSQAFVGIGVGEFDELWANAIELTQAKSQGQVHLPVSTLYSEFFSFVPSQFLWFEKSTLSIWFLDNFYPHLKDVGGGLAFGALSQSIIGYGIVEALIRGLMLGGVAIFIMKWYRGTSRVWWRFPLYLYILIWVYQSVRDTTFSLFGIIIQTVIPAIVTISLISIVLRFRSSVVTREPN